jgi:SAM-dependent methyltransferase
MVMVNSEFNPSISHPYYFIRKNLYQKIGEYADQLTGDLLDFGCGSKPYKSLFTQVTSYTGVDFENPGHPHLNEQIDCFYDGKTLPFESDRFDCIFCSEVFEHLFNLEQILPELNRVLKPGGKILITCPFVWPEHEKPHDFARYTVYALKSRLESNGFDTLVIDKSGDFFTALYQIRLVYFHDVFLPKLSLRFLIRTAKATVIPVLNMAGLLLQKLLPTNKDLYLNNIILAQKIS